MSLGQSDMITVPGIGQACSLLLTAGKPCLGQVTKSDLELTATPDSMTCKYWAVHDL